MQNAKCEMRNANSVFSEIIQGPGFVALRNEMIHETRIVYLDGRPQISPQIRMWKGSSRGRWEGSTLVVETTKTVDDLPPSIGEAHAERVGSRVVATADRPQHGLRCDVRVAFEQLVGALARQTAKPRDDLRGVLLEQFLTQLPRASQEIEMGVTVEIEVSEIGNRLGRTVR